MKLISLGRFKFRTFFVLYTALIIWLGFNASRAYNQRLAVGVVSKLGGTVYYDYQEFKRGARIAFPAGSRVNKDGSTMSWSAGSITIVDERCSYLVGAYLSVSSPVPAWIRRWIGDDMFVRVIAVNLEDAELTDKQASALAGLPHVRVLHLSRTRISDKGLAEFASLKKLEQLTLDGTSIDGSGLAQLYRLPHLEQLSLAGSQITDVGLQW